MTKEDVDMFPSIGEVVESEEAMPMEISSLCMNCYEQGMTKLLMTTIPFFKQVILISFRCPHCGFASNEIKPGAPVQDKGCSYELKLTSADDLQRHVVKSDSAVFRIPELDFEIPKGKGVLSTIEGMLQTAQENLEDSQEDRRRVAPEVADQVEAFIARLSEYTTGQRIPFSVVLDDPAGNSFVENPLAPKMDPHMRIVEYIRSKEQQDELGLSLEEYELDPVDETQQHVKAGSTMVHDETFVKEKEVYEIESPCPNCQVVGSSKTCMTDIPFFKEIIIMAFNCEACGFKSNEVKGGGAVPEKGKTITLTVEKKDSDPEQFEADMKRDVVKSNTAGVRLPELDLEVTNGSLGGLYTTVEGLLTLIKETLFDGQASEMYKGDSAMDATKQRFIQLEQDFDKLIAGEIPFTIVIHDPMANSYIYSPTAPEPEARLIETEFERTFEDNEELGLNDMCTENYEELTAKPDIQTTHAHYDNDDHLEFDGPYETFQGVKPNMVFRLGTKGLGYYADNQDLAVFEKMKRLQKDGTETHPHHVDAPI